MVCSCPADAHAKDPPGSRYWISIRDAQRRAFVAGPYPTHGEAESDVELVRRLGEGLDPCAVWYAWGTSRTDADLEVPPPALNAARDKAKAESKK